MTRYPLSWPEGWKRTPHGQRDRARFSKGDRQYTQSGSWIRKRELTINDATTRVLEALRILGVQDGDAIISTNLQVRLDGLPRSGQPAPADPGVAVYWQRRGHRGQQCMAIDRYDRVADNLAAIAATLEALRAIERHGGAQIMDRAFTGFAALPAPGATVARGWREVLGIAPDAQVTETVIDEKFRRLAAVHHPDKGGDAAAFQELTAARMQAREAIGLGGSNRGGGAAL